MEKGRYNDPLFASRTRHWGASPKPHRSEVAETEGFEPSIGLYNPITV